MALGEDLNFLAGAYLPISTIGQAIQRKEGEGRHQAIAKTEDCRYVFVAVPLRHSYMECVG